MRLLIIGVLVVSCLACGQSEDPVEAPQNVIDAVGGVAPADAGDTAFAQRLVPFMWGRRPISVREVEVLAAMAQSAGREALVRAMAQSPEYLTRWELFLKDALAAERHGFDASPACYGRSLHPEPSTALAEHVRDNDADGAPFDQLWTMRDLMHSSLLLDDLSPIYRVHLLAQIGFALDDRNQPAAIGQRRKRAQRFLATYLNRQMLCLGCHNTEFSVTDSSDPLTDRHWPIGGLFEKVLFEDSFGRDISDLNRLFRRKNVVAGYFYTQDDMDDQRIPEFKKGVTPWGWDESCGRLVAVDKVADDDNEQSTGWFMAPLADNASMWDLEMSFAVGFSELQAGPDPAAPDFDPSADPEQTLAYLVALNLTDQVWKAAFGHRLTLPHVYPRNVAQHEILRNLADTFVRGGYSLLDVLVAVTTHPYFNGALPGEGESPRVYAAVFDPFVEPDLPPADRRNQPGDTIKRADARILLGSAYHAMGWPAVPEYLLFFMSDAAVAQRGAGVFLKTGDPGFPGISFQSALNWEALFSACADRSTDPECPLTPILDADLAQIATVCELCNSRDYACDWDARCCDLPWDAYCDGPGGCDTGDPRLIDLRTFPKPSVPANGDVITKLMELGGDSATLGDGVAALKDRLINDPGLSDPDERAALEALVGKSLDTPLAGAEDELRRACGVFLSTPQFMLTGWPQTLEASETPALVLPGTSFKDLCEGLGATLFGAGKVTCTANSLEIK